jgi:uncharacterized membrane protein
MTGRFPTRHMASREEINRQEYADESNRHYVLYASRGDSRILVPKKKGLPGYTVNFAKPLGIMIHAFIIAVLTVAVVFGYCTFIGN